MEDTVVKMLTNLKDKLATIRADSWHARLVRLIFKNKDFRRQKACPYYWFYVPSSAFLVGFMLLIAAIVSVVYPFWAVTAWFFGYQPVNWSFIGYLGNDKGVEATHGYKLKEAGTERGTTTLVPVKTAPYQVGLPMMMGAALVLGAMAIGMSTIWSALLASLPWLGVVAGGAIVLYLLGKFAAPFIANKYNEACPNIIWVEPEEDQENVASS